MSHSNIIEQCNINPKTGKKCLPRWTDFDCLKIEFLLVSIIDLHRIVGRVELNLTN